MARHTIIGDTLMSKYRGHEGRVRMASGTILICRQMVGCLKQLRFGGKELADMTTFTTARDVEMSCR